MGGLIERLMAHLWPPPHPDPNQDKWQKGITMMMWAVVAGTVLFAAGSANQIPGVEGFAQRSDVTDVKASVDSLTTALHSVDARIIAQDIYEARKEQCRAIEEKDSAAKPGPLRRLNELMFDYQRVTGQPYRLSGCDEI